MILIVEPQCVNFEHADFNTGLISVIANSYSNEKVVLWAEEEHLNCLKNNDEFVNNKQIESSIIEIPERHLSEHKRFYDDFKIVLKTLKYSKKNNINSIFFLSLTSAGLLALKIIKPFFPNISAYVVLHGLLGDITNPPPKKVKQKIFEYKNVLYNFNNSKIKYILLCESIKKELLKLNDRLKNNLITIDIPPYEHKIVDEKEFKEKQLNEKIKFATFGVAHKAKGSDSFFELTEKISKDNADFYLIGHITDKTLIESIKKYQNIKIPSAEKPLTRKEFDDLAKDVDYTIFSYPKDRYILRASGAFFDAVHYIKPIIAIRSPFYEHYFNKYGNIGYLCDSMQDMQFLIEKLITERPQEEYNEQCLSILKMKKELSVDNISTRLKKQINQEIK